MALRMTIQSHSQIAHGIAAQSRNSDVTVNIGTGTRDIWFKSGVLC